MLSKQFSSTITHMPRVTSPGSWAAAQRYYFARLKKNNTAHCQSSYVEGANSFLRLHDLVISIPATRFIATAHAGILQAGLHILLVSTPSSEATNYSRDGPF